jgi:hypothetical protein
MRKKRMVIGLSGAIAMLFSLGFIDDLVSQPVIRVFGDSMDWRSRWLMGSRGIDCGTVEVNADPRRATDCAIKAQDEGRPFRVRYDIMGYD